jgi:hypothetical protein
MGGGDKMNEIINGFMTAIFGEEPTETAKHNTQPAKRGKNTMKKQELLGRLENLSSVELVPIVNEYAEAMRDDESYIYYMEEFNDIMQCKTPLEIAQEIYQTDFCPNCDFFTWGIYGVKSADFVADLVYLEDVAEWLEREGRTL